MPSDGMRPPVACVAAGIRRSRGHHVSEVGRLLVTAYATLCLEVFIRYDPKMIRKTVG